MNKQQLVNAISSETKLSKSATEKAVNGFINAATRALKKGERVALVGFGSFTVVKRNARTGRNPQTGKPIQIKARKVTKFRAGNDLVSAVNK